MTDLIDAHQRKFVYLRLSVTDRCNFRCVYCLPRGYEPTPNQEVELRQDEIVRLMRAFSLLGVSKIRLTGGEPTVRRDLVEIAQQIHQIPGIEKVAITTNGHRLLEIGRSLKAAGIHSLNVSLDSLDPDTFNRLTGTDRFAQVFRGIDHALELGFPEVKINAVLMRESAEQEFRRFTEWVKHRPVTVRFIELMRTGRNVNFFDNHHQTAGGIQFQLLRAGWRQKQRSPDAGPATIYEHDSSLGKIGLIAPYSRDFCTNCNRLRVTSRGALRLCLFGEKDESLRSYLQDDGDTLDLAERIRDLLKEKPATHFLHEGKYGNTGNLASIGG